MAAKEKKTVKSEKKNQGTLLSGFSLDKFIPVKFQTLFLLLIILRNLPFILFTALFWRKNISIR